MYKSLGLAILIMLGLLTVGCGNSNSNSGNVNGTWTAKLTNPDGSPAFLGLRYQVLSLVLIAGNLRLEACRPTVLSVAQAASTGSRFWPKCRRSATPSMKRYMMSEPDRSRAAKAW